MYSRTFTPCGRATQSTAIRVLAAACISLVAACGTSTTGTPRATQPASASSHPPSIAPPSTAASTSSTHTYSYRSTKKGCDLIPFNSLSAVLGEDAGNLTNPHFQQTAVATFARCDRQFGALGSRSLVGIQVMVGTPGSASAVADFWNGMRAADAKGHTLTADPELAAQGAYGFTDDQIGPHLTVYDGNLYLRISINQITRQTVPPAQVTQLLNDVARNAMSTMAS